MNEYNNVNYLVMSKEELNLKYSELLKDYDGYKNKKLNLDMSRGKPSLEQLDLSNEILDIEIPNVKVDNIDVRNYGCLDGLPTVKKLFSDVFDIDENKIIIGGNSSLSLMYDVISNLMVLPQDDSDKPWCEYKRIKFLCPVPGYDRHFSICQKFEIEMINIEMTDSGPNMNQVENLVREDNEIKGMWCVPQYSNPTGVTYSDETVKKLANLNPRARDFKIFWDNAYAVHHLYDNHFELLDILEECKKSGNENMVYVFYSTSKMTFPGGGISFFVSSADNISKAKKWLSTKTIGYDKINQLRHVLFFKNAEGVKKHMKKHANILRPKFEVVNKILSQELKSTNLAKWSNPLGGYFVSVDTLAGCARRVVKLCKDAGVIFTPAGSTFPYKNDPNDSNIRIAPSYPKLNELITSMNLFCLAVKIAGVEKLLLMKDHNV